MRACFGHVRHLLWPTALTETDQALETRGDLTHNYCVPALCVLDDWECFLIRFCVICCLSAHAYMSLSQRACIHVSVSARMHTCLCLSAHAYMSLSQRACIQRTCTCALSMLAMSWQLRLVAVTRARGSHEHARMCHYKVPGCDRCASRTHVCACVGTS